MAIETHIRQLEERHQQLEAQLDEMLNQPSASDSDIADVKRQKLQLKDKISYLKIEHSIH